MAGQSWFDVSQYRVHPPEGVPMHWSRLVDIPLAAFIAFFSLLVSTPMEAERLAMVVVPLLTFACLFATLAALTVRVTGDRAMAVFATLMLAISMGVIMQFQPMRIDHHGWQIVLDALAVFFIVGASRGHSARAAWAGVTIAFSLIIGAGGAALGRRDGPVSRRCAICAIRPNGAYSKPICSGWSAAAPYSSSSCSAGRAARCRGAIPCRLPICCR